MDLRGPLRHFGGAPVSGTIELNGCQVSPRHLQLRADPLTASVDGVVTEPDRHTRSRRGIVLRTRNPNLFRFILPGLDRTGLYRLSIAAPPNPCGKVFWRGPFEGLVTAGSHGVRIEGFAATTEVEVFDVEADAWVGASAMSLADAAEGGAVKRLRWRSRLADVVSGELQISTSAFPTDGAFGACDEPAGGLVLRTEVPFEPGGWTELGEFDFASLFGRIFEPPGDEIPAPPAFATEPAQNEIPADDNNVVPVGELEQMLINMGAPLYLRVIPRRADGAACEVVRDGLAGWVLVADNVGRTPPEYPLPAPQPPIEFGDGHEYFPPFFAIAGGQLVPRYNQQGFAVIKPRQIPGNPGICDFLAGRDIDPLGCWIRDQWPNFAGTVLNPPFRFLYVQQSSGGGGSAFDPLIALTNSLGNLMTGAYTVFSYGIDAAAKAFEEIKNSVAKLALKFLSLPPLGGACSEIADGPVTCEDIVRTGITVGLASMGLPPSIPNFDELKDRGVEYLAAEIQSSTGVPQIVAEQALVIAKERLEEMAANRGGSDIRYNWVTPWFGVDPAYAEIVVRKNVPDPTDSGLILVRQHSDQYLGGSHPIPAVFPPSRELRIPMVLRLNTQGITNPICTIGPFEISCTPSVFATRPICLYGSIPASGPIVYTEGDCSNSTAVDIYFRDEWYRQRYENTPCTGITLRSARSSGLGPVPPPLGFEMLMAAAMDPRQHSTWNGSFYFGCFGT